MNRRGFFRSLAGLAVTCAVGEKVIGWLAPKNHYSYIHGAQAFYSKKSLEVLRDSFSFRCLEHPYTAYDIKIETGKTIKFSGSLSE